MLGGIKNRMSNGNFFTNKSKIEILWEISFTLFVEDHVTMCMHAYNTTHKKKTFGIITGERWALSRYLSFSLFVFHPYRHKVHPLMFLNCKWWTLMASFWLMGFTLLLTNEFFIICRTAGDEGYLGLFLDRAYFADIFLKMNI